MGVEQKNLETSIPVPNVQELARQHIDTVPARYVRDDVDRRNSTNNSSLCAPVIDMNKLMNPESQETEIQKLHAACKDWGIFQLINHGVSDESLKDMSKQADEFFQLPIEEKKRWAQKPGSLEGYGQAFVTSETQKLDWNDMFFVKALPIQSRNLEFWPENPPKFRESLDRYSEDMKQVTVALSRFMAMGLEIDDQELCEAYDQDGQYRIRMNYYPPCPQPELAMGASPHKDFPALSLVFECYAGDTPALQVLKDGQWVSVEPINGAFVVNIGIATEILSNGIYKAPEHRILANKVKERLAIVTFCYPNMSFNVGPAKSLINSENPPLFKSITVEEYLQHLFNRKNGVPEISRLKI